MTTLILARHYHPGRIEKVRVLVPHSTESPERAGAARNVAEWWHGPTSAISSAHVVIDPREVIQCVPWDDTAYAAPGANADGEHFEMCGTAGQSKSQWTDEDSRAVIESTAQVMARRCIARDIPVRYLTDAQLADGRTPGIAHGHVQVSRVFRISTHTDPGPNFPFDLLLSRIERYRGILLDKNAKPDPVPSLNVPPFPGLIKLGDRGKHVIRWKRRMAARGWRIDTASWVYGEQAAAVCTAFEREKGLAVEEPGVVGKQVWRAAWTAPVA